MEIERHTMKKNFYPIAAAIAGVVAFFVIYFANAQIPVSAAQDLLTSSSCAATTTVTKNLSIDCSKQANVGVQITQVNSAAGVSNVTYSFKRSVNGTQFDTVGFDVVVPSNGTNTVS